MMNFKRLLALLLAAILCGSMAAAQGPADVLATVNGTPIHRAEFEEYLDTLGSYYAYLGYSVASDEDVAYLKYLALNTLLQTALMDQKIAELGVSLTAAEAAAARQEGSDLWVEDVRSYMAAYYGVTSASSEMERAQAMVEVVRDLEALGYSEQGYLDDAAENALYQKLEDTVATAVSVSPQEVTAYYEQMIQSSRDLYLNDAVAFETALLLGENTPWVQPEGYRRVTHILLNVDEGLLNDWADLQATLEEQEEAEASGAVTTQELQNAEIAILAAAQPRVDEILEQLAGGAPFADLIPRYTADAAMDTPEEIALGFQVHMDSILFPVGYRDAAFRLEAIGEVSSPFVTEDGVYLLCYAADVPGGPVALSEELYAAIHAELLANAQYDAFNQALQGWMDTAEIDYSEEAAAFMVFE